MSEAPDKRVFGSSEYSFDDPVALCEQPIEVGMTGPQAQAEAVCLAALEHDNADVRVIALVALGHSARVNKAIAPTALNALIVRLNYPSLAGYAENALDDVAVFVYGVGGWQEVPGVPTVG
jgi:hypothetical protein